jgi:hypothetical protein
MNKQKKNKVQDIKLAFKLNYLTIDDVIRQSIEYGQSLSREKLVNELDKEIKGMIGRDGYYNNNGSATKEQAYERCIEIIKGNQDYEKV